jgi:hypothetical protein
MSAEVRGPRSDDRGPHDRLDLAIDRAVCEMLDVEPRADLRARVIARIDSGHRRGGSRTAPALWAATFAAAALIVLAIFVARQSEPLPQAPVTARAGDRHLPPEATTPRGAVQTPPLHVMPPAVHVTAASRGAGAGTVFPGEDHATAVIEPLKTITPIAVAPITQDSIAPTDIAVHPLNTINEIQIAPLTPADRRN